MNVHMICTTDIDILYLLSFGMHTAVVVVYSQSLMGNMVFVHTMCTHDGNIIVPCRCQNQYGPIQFIKQRYTILWYTDLIYACIVTLLGSNIDILIIMNTPSEYILLHVAAYNISSLVLNFCFQNVNDTLSYILLQ